MRQFKERIPATYFEMLVMTKDGATACVGQRVQLVTDKGRVLYYQAVCRDISDCVMAQQALQDFNPKLRELTARQEDLLEAERTRIAHDLRDGIGQSLNLARAKLSAITGRGGIGDHETALEEVMHIIDETTAVIRSMEFDLSSPVLRELGLEPALEWLSEEMRRIYGLKVKLSNDGEPKPLSQVASAVAFRSVRELLINVVRHAGTLDAHVDTQVDGGYAVITVSDEGKGFDPDAAVRSLGPPSINERMTHVGDSATITASRGEGAVISLLLPLEGTDSQKGTHDNSSGNRR